MYVLKYNKGDCIRTIVVKYRCPDELKTMLGDFQNITNHLISYALYKRTTSVFILRDEQYEWFRENYGGKYAVHYLHSACSYAMGIVKSWREVGQAKLPHLYRSVARLDQMLVKVKEITSNSVKLQITVAPRQYVIVDLDIKHRKFREWSKYKLGEITIHKDTVDLPFQVPDKKSNSPRAVGIDLNFNHADLASSDGDIDRVDLSEITTIQKRMKRKRESVRKSIPNNLKKQRKVLKKHKKRERNRVKEVIYTKAEEILAKAKDHIIIFEDLSTTTEECLKDAGGKVFRAKLSSWAHGKLQAVVDQNSSTKTKYVYAGGTSSYCPFCDSKLAHPSWKESVCPVHGIFDRDSLASIAIAMRGQKFLRRAPFPPSVIASLFEGSVLGHGDMARQENRIDLMTRDASNVYVSPHG